MCHSPWPLKPPAQPCSGAASLILKSHLWCEEREDGERGWLRPGTGACRAYDSIHRERCGQEPGLSLVAVCLCPVGLEPGIPLGLDYPGVTGFQLSDPLHEVSGGGRDSGRVAEALPCNESVLWGACRKRTHDAISARLCFGDTHHAASPLIPRAEGTPGCSWTPEVARQHLLSAHASFAGPGSRHMASAILCTQRPLQGLQTARHQPSEDLTVDTRAVDSGVMRLLFAGLNGTCSSSSVPTSTSETPDYLL